MTYKFNFAPLKALTLAMGLTAGTTSALEAATFGFDVGIRGVTELVPGTPPSLGGEVPASPLLSEMGSIEFVIEDSLIPVDGVLMADALTSFSLNILGQVFDENDLSAFTFSGSTLDAFAASFNMGNLSNVNFNIFEVPEFLALGELVEVFNPIEIDAPGVVGITATDFRSNDAGIGLLVAPTAVIPLPAAGWLLLAGLGALGFAGRTRRSC